MCVVRGVEEEEEEGSGGHGNLNLIEKGVVQRMRGDEGENVEGG